MVTVPLLVLWLVLGAIFFTVRMGFVNLRGFGHAIQVTRGRFTDPNAHGEHDAPGHARADQSGVARIATPQHTNADLEIEPMAVRHDEEEAVRRHGGHFEGRLVAFNGANIARHVSKDIAAAVDPADVAVES